MLRFDGLICTAELYPSGVSLQSACAPSGAHSVCMQVLLTLQRLVNALGTDSPRCYDLLLPILRHCTDINQPDELNLLEDGLQLWLIALRNAPTHQEPLLSLFPNLAAVMERSPGVSSRALRFCSTLLCALLVFPDFMVPCPPAPKQWVQNGLHPFEGFECSCISVLWLHSQ